MSIAEKLVQIAENEKSIYDNGRRTVHDQIWDTYQDFGNRSNYQRAFTEGWNDKNFKPKYNMKPSNANEMFLNSKITDLKAILEKQKVLCP